MRKPDCTVSCEGPKLQHHLHGPHFPFYHKAITGAIVMIIGVGVAKAGHHIETTALQYLLDMIGYAIHGVGVIPYIEKYIEQD